MFSVNNLKGVIMPDTGDECAIQIVEQAFKLINTLSYNIVCVWDI